MIIRGGENIYPREIEEFLYTHPAIADVQVIGVPDARYGEEVMAWVRAARRAPTLDADGDPRLLPRQDRHLQDPALLRFVDDFPMTVTGKVQKFKMRDEMAADLGLTEAATA